MKKTYHFVKIFLKKMISPLGDAYLQCSPFVWNDF